MSCVVYFSYQNKEIRGVSSDTVSNKTKFTITESVQKLQDDPHMLGTKNKEHEDKHNVPMIQKNKVGGSKSEPRCNPFLFSMDFAVNVKQIHLKLVNEIQLK